MFYFIIALLLFINLLRKTPTYLSIKRNERTLDNALSTFRHSTMEEQEAIITITQVAVWVIDILMALYFWKVASIVSVFPFYILIAVKIATVLYDTLSYSVKDIILDSQCGKIRFNIVYNVFLLILNYAVYITSLYYLAIHFFM